MKVSWAPEDIYCGLRVGRDNDKIGNGMIVGYDPRTHSPSTNPALCIISLDDGMILAQGMNPKLIAEWLTHSDQLPVEVLGRRKAERH